MSRTNATRFREANEVVRQAFAFLRQRTHSLILNRTEIKKPDHFLTGSWSAL